jgi:hypothetical protein
MKFTIALAVIVGFFMAPVASRAEQAKQNTPQALAKTVKGLVGVHDAMRDITWYKNSTSPKYGNTNTFYLYFGITDDQVLTPLRLKITYASDSWLFVKSVWGKADGKKIEIPQISAPISGWERDNGSGNIWEWSDAPIEDAHDIAFFRQLALSKAVTLRFEGQQYYSDRTLSGAQLQAVRDMISAYEVVTAKPWQ